MGSHGIPLMTFCLYTMILVLVCLDFIMIYFYLDSQGNGFSHATCFWMTIYVLLTPNNSTLSILFQICFS